LILRRIGIILEVIFIKFQEFSNSFNALFIGGSRFRVDKSKESPHFVRVNFDNIIVSGFKEVKEIFVVDTSGFHTYEEIRFIGRDKAVQFREGGGMHLHNSVFDKEGAIFEGEGEAVFGDIQAEEVRGFHKGITSFRLIRGQAALGLNLPHEMSLSGSINLFEPERARDTLLFEPLSSGGMVSCPLGLDFINFGHMASTNYYLNYQNLN
jgi:hypothetical protein